MSGSKIIKDSIAVSQIEASSDVPLYDAVGGGKCDPSYSMVTMATMNRENIYSEAATASNAGNNDDKVPTRLTNKVVILLVVILASAVLISSCCFIAMFIELRSEMSSFRQTRVLQNSKVQQLDTVINGNLSGIMDELGELNSNLRQLNTSLSHLNTERLPSIEDELVEVNSNIQRLNSSLNDTNYHFANHVLGLTVSFPTPSCAALPPSSPSGYYWVRASNGSAVRVYCDMTRSCGNITRGWMRVAELDMTNSSHQCPRGLRQRTYSNKRTCVRDSDPPGCSPVTISSATVEYSKVCGKIIAYQFGSPDGFSRRTVSIDLPYVEGVSLTHGRPRQHVWTLAASHGACHHCKCLCTNTVLSQAFPAFVGSDYFCDTGSGSGWQFIFYGSDPLWDGAGCRPLNTCCSFNNPPWFYKQLPQPTTDDVEMRVCRNSPSHNEDVAIESVEIYVQ
jgi:phage gp36-like protein